MEWDAVALRKLHLIKARALGMVPKKFEKLAKSKIPEVEIQIREKAESFAKKSGRERVIEEDLIEALKWLVPLDKRTYLIKVLLMASVDVSKYFDKYDLYDLNK
mgnify:CR=1 FL=1